MFDIKKLRESNPKPAIQGEVRMNEIGTEVVLIYKSNDEPDGYNALLLDDTNPNYYYSDGEKNFTSVFSKNLTAESLARSYPIVVESKIHIG